MRHRTNLLTAIAGIDLDRNLGRADVIALSPAATRPAGAREPSAVEARP